MFELLGHLGLEILDPLGTLGYLSLLIRVGVILVEHQVDVADTLIVETLEAARNLSQISDLVSINIMPGQIH